jgi:hypothetical protein
MKLIPRAAEPADRPGPGTTPDPVHDGASWPFPPGPFRRARGGCGPLLTTGSGYALCRECVQLDLAEFDTLTAKGRRALGAGEPGPASELFADALAVWRTLAPDRH